MRRKLGRTTRGRDLAIRKEVLKYPGHSRLANTKFGGNRTGGMMIGGQRKDIFLLSRRDGVHDELWDAKGSGPGYIASIQVLSMITSLW
jgi:hypothetical protein